MSKTKKKRIIFAENLSYLMTQHNISAEALNKMLAKKFQWSGQSNSINTIKGYAQGSQLPNSKRRQQIASIFGVTDAYMLTKHKNRVPLCNAPTDPKDLLQQNSKKQVNSVSDASANPSDNTPPEKLLHAPSQQIHSGFTEKGKDVNSQRLALISKIMVIPDKDIPLVDWLFQGIEFVQQASQK